MKSDEVLSIVVLIDLSVFLKLGFITLNLPFISSSDNVNTVSSVIPLPK